MTTNSGQLERKPWHLLILQGGWFLFLLYSIFASLVSGASYVDQVRFDRSYEDTFAYFSEWFSYFEFLRAVSVIFIALAAYFLLVAVFIYVRRSTDPVGILTSVALMGVPNVMLLSRISDLGAVWSFIESAMILFWSVALTLLLFLFPNGTAIPQRSEKYLKYVYIGILLFIGLTVFNDIYFLISLLAASILFVAGIVSQLYRYIRVSSAAEKQQTKWVFFSLMFLIMWSVFLLINPGRSLRFEARAPYGLFLITTGFIVVLMVPVAFTISILRYRLFDIDLIIRRTLQYGLLTGLLVGIYFGLIVLLQTGLTLLTGQGSSPVVTVVSTLLIAAIFHPLRSRIQQLIDRRFYRASYNAERVLEKFSVSARNEVDLDELGNSILNVAESTLQPDQVSLWLKLD